MTFFTNALNAMFLITFVFGILRPVYFKVRYKEYHSRLTKWDLFCKDMVLFVAVLAFVRQFMFEHYKIPSESMRPNLQVGDYVLVSKMAYGAKFPFTNHEILSLGTPSRGDVSVFHYPFAPDETFIKRIVGLPGDEIVATSKGLEVRDASGSVYCQIRVKGTAGMYENNGEHWYRVIGSESPKIGDFVPRYDGRRVTVPDNAYFVLGDNRDNSLDSRYWGFVESEMLVGRAVMHLLNFSYSNGEGLLPGGFISGVSFKKTGTSPSGFLDDTQTHDSISNYISRQGAKSQCL